MLRKLILAFIFTAGLGLVAAATDNTGPGTGPDNGNDGKKDELSGNVMDADSKKPLKDVSVTAYNTVTSKKEKVFHTDASGNYNFDELQPGKYKFIFEKAGFRKVVREKTISKADEGFLLNVEMVEQETFDMVPAATHFFDVK
jgi:5-hydroxyisourate hydrolase-like protein (transthyretin family)